MKSHAFFILNTARAAAAFMIAQEVLNSPWPQKMLSQQMSPKNPAAAVTL